MLDDITRRFISLYPGSFEPYYAAHTPKSYNGFRVYIRPPIGLYRTHQPVDMAKSKVKMDDVTIRKLYKAASFSKCNLQGEEPVSSFQHKLTTEELLAKYLETSIYSKTRMRKVNRASLVKAVMAAKNAAKLNITRKDSIEERPKDGERVWQAESSDSEEKQPVSKIYRPDTNHDKQDVQESSSQDQIETTSPNHHKRHAQSNVGIKRAKIYNKRSKTGSTTVSKSLECVESQDGNSNNKRTRFANCTKIVTFKKCEYSFSDCSLNERIRPKTPAKPTVERDNVESNGIEHMFSVNRGISSRGRRENENQQRSSESPDERISDQALAAPEISDTAAPSEDLPRHEMDSSSMEKPVENLSNCSTDNNKTEPKNCDSKPEFKGRKVYARKRASKTEKICLALPIITPSLELFEVKENSKRFEGSRKIRRL